MSFRFGPLDEGFSPLVKMTCELTTISPRWHLLVRVSPPFVTNPARRDQKQREAAGEFDYLAQMKYWGVSLSEGI